MHAQPLSDLPNSFLIQHLNSTSTAFEMEIVRLAAQIVPGFL
jgi:hypothetical protein